MSTFGKRTTPIVRQPPPVVRQASERRRASRDATKQASSVADAPPASGVSRWLLRLLFTFLGISIAIWAYISWPFLAHRFAIGFNLTNEQWQALLLDLAGNVLIASVVAFALAVGVVMVWRQIEEPPPAETMPAHYIMSIPLGYPIGIAAGLAGFMLFNSSGLGGLLSTSPMSVFEPVKIKTDGFLLETNPWMDLASWVGMALLVVALIGRFRLDREAKAGHDR